MTPFRLIAIAAIYVIAAAAWFVLGTSVAARSGEFDGRLSREVALLWGGPHAQSAPAVWGPCDCRDLIGMPRESANLAGHRDCQSASA